jgi:hypothetical protein
VDIALVDLTNLITGEAKSSREKEICKSTASPEIKQQVSTSIYVVTKSRVPKVMAQIGLGSDCLELLTKAGKRESTDTQVRFS